MRKKFKNIGILACLAILFLFVSDAFAPWKYNPFTRKLDYYSMDVGAGLVGEAAGDVLYHDGTNWVNLPRANNTDVLTLVAGLPAWVAAGAPGAHAATHEVGGGDLVDHDQLTNYLAGQHLALPSTIVATLTDHNLAAHTALGLNDMANVFYVSATGGDYATIQAALTAQAVAGATFVVGTGVYANDTIYFTANAQTVIGIGRGINSSVTQADTNIVDASTFTDCRVVNMAIRLTAPTTAINAIQVDTGSLGIIDCRVYLATAVALAQVNQPSLVGFTDAGTIVLKGGLHEYYHTGACGGTAIKAALRANIDLCLLRLHKIDLVEVTNSGTALATALFVSTGTAVVEMHNCVDVIVTDPNATNVVGMGYTGGAGVHNLQGNHIDVVATNNTSYGLYHDGSAEIRSAFNAIHASDAAGSSYAFFVGASATLTSHFDDLRSGDGNTINGTFYRASSEVDGSFIASGTLSGATYGSDGSVSDAELLYINTLGSDAQTQINGKQATDAALTDLSTVAVNAGRYIRVAGVDDFEERTTVNVLADIGAQAASIVLTELSALADPGADKFISWDDTANNFIYSAVITPIVGGVSVGAAGNFGKLELEDDDGDVLSHQVGDMAGDTIYTWPVAFGTTGWVLSSTDAGIMSWVASGTGDVTAGAVMTNHSIVRGDGGAKGIQDSGIIVDDTDNLSAIGTIACGTVTIADGSSINLEEDVTFTGATGVNLIKFPDHLAEALVLEEGGTSYQTFITTNGSEEIRMNVGVQFDTIAYFIAEYDEGAEGGAFTIDWNNGQKQKVTITGVALDMSFTDPPGPCNLILKVVQGDGDDTIDWTHDTKIGGAGGTAPTLSTGNADEDIFALYFDGTNYWVSVLLDIDLFT